MNLRERFRRFWYVPTIDAMQAQMLREIPAIAYHRRLARTARNWNRSLFSDSNHLQELYDAIKRGIT